MLHGLKKPRDIHTAGELAHFPLHHFLGLGQGVVHRRQHQVLKHLHIIRVYDFFFNGKQQIVSLEIEKEVVDPDDVEMLQDLVLAAVNDALAKSQEMVQAEMGKLTGGMNIPGLF